VLPCADIRKCLTPFLATLKELGKDVQIRFAQPVALGSGIQGPARKTATTQKSSMPNRPEPGAPTITSSTIMFANRTPPLSGMKLSCILLTAPSEEAVETFANSGRGNAETYFLAFHVSGDLPNRIRLGLHKGMRRIAARF
jgi:hypothetical protein